MNANVRMRSVTVPLRLVVGPLLFWQGLIFPDRFPWYAHTGYFGGMALIQSGILLVLSCL